MWIVNVSAVLLWRRDAPDTQGTMGQHEAVAP